MRDRNIGLRAWVVAFGRMARRLRSREADRARAGAPAVDADLFVDRRAELSRIINVQGPLCLWGPSGIGKSALLRAASRAAPRLVILPARGPDGAELRAALRGLAGGLEGASYAAWLRISSTILTIDGLERWPLEAARTLLLELGDAPFVYTSFSPFGLPGETTVALGPLPARDAALLFAQRGGPPGDLAPFAGGSPLALEILAAWAREGEDPPPFAGASSDRGFGLQRVLGAAIQSLAPSARRALETLACAPDELPLDALPELTGDSSESALLAIAALARRGLAVISLGDAHVPAAVRAAVRDGLDEATRTGYEDAHAAWCLRLVSGLPEGHGGFDGAAAFSMVRKHRRHLGSAFERLLPTSPEGAAALALALDPLHVLEGETAMHAAQLERAAEATPQPTQRAECAVRLARIASLRGMAGVALAIVTEAEALAVAAPAVRARLAGGRAHALLLIGESSAGHDAAETCREAALAITDAGERDRLLAFAHQELAVAQGLLGDLARAREHHETSVLLARRRGATRMLALALANAAMATGVTEAERGARLAESLALFDAVGDRRHVVKLRYWLTRLAEGARRRVLLEALATDAAAIADDATHASVRLDLVELACADGDDERARSELGLAGIPLAFSDDPEEHARATRLSAALSGKAAGRQVKLKRDGTRVWVDDLLIDLDNRRALPALVAALGRDAMAEVPNGLDVTEMFQAGWPNQRASVGSLAARVHVGVRTLRTLGLGAVLVTRRGRYGFADDVTVSWLDLARFSALPRPVLYTSGMRNVSGWALLSVLGLGFAAGCGDDGAAAPVGPKGGAGGVGGGASGGAAGASGSSAIGGSAGSSTGGSAGSAALGGPLPLPAARAIAFEPCSLFSDGTGPAAECGELVVPLRASDPQGQTISTFVKRYRSATTEPTTQLVMLSGGPGGPGMIYETITQAIVDKYPQIEIYLPDHRGTGRSSRLTCEYEESDISLNGHFLAPTEWPECIATMKEIWGDRLDAFNTTNAAHDIGVLVESIRREGVKPIVFGASYGTLWAQRYLQLFPAQAGGVVLDAIVPPIASLAQQDVDSDAAGRDILAGCAADEKCRAHLGDDPYARGQGIFAMLQAGHCKKITKAYGEPRDKLRKAFGTMTMNEKARELIPAALARIERCNADDVKAINQLLKAHAGIGGNDLVYRQWGWYLSNQIALSEMWETPSPTEAQLAATREALLISRDVTVGFEGVLDTLPRYQPDAYYGGFATTQVPMLMLQGTWDPATRPEPAKAVRDHYTGEKHQWIDIPRGSHGVLGWQQTPEGTSCGSSLVLQFVLAPETKVDTSCLAKVRPVSFDGLPAVNKQFFGTEDAWGDAPPTP